MITRKQFVCSLIPPASCLLGSGCDEGTFIANPLRSDGGSGRIKSLMITDLWCDVRSGRVNADLSRISGSGLYNAVSALVDLDAGSGEHFRSYVVAGRNQTQLAEHAAQNIRACRSVGLTPIIIARADWSVDRGRRPPSAGSTYNGSIGSFYDNPHLESENEFHGVLSGRGFIQASLEATHALAGSFYSKLSGDWNNLLGPAAEMYDGDPHNAHSVNDCQDISPGILNYDGARCINGDSFDSVYRRADATGKSFVIWDKDAVGGSIPDYLFTLKNHK